MNILILVSSLNFGGAEKQVVEDANFLCNDNKVTVLAFEEGPLLGLLSSNVNFILIKNRNYHTTPFSIASIIKKKKIAIIHAHLYAPMIISGIAGQLSNTPVIWNFHSHAYENSWKGKLIHRLVSKFGSVKKILFPASELENYYAKEGYGFNKKKCAIAHNSGQKVELTKAYATENTTKVVQLGFIGRVVPLKRIEILIELAQFLLKKSVNNFKIVVVGDGSELNNLIQMADERNLSDYMDFVGFQSDTLSFFRNFDIFAFPSREEVLSLSLIDAGLSSLPSVAFDVGGNEEIVNHNSTGYLVKTKGEFFNRCLDLIRQPELRKRLGINARIECLEKFSPQTRLKYLTNLYEQFI